MRFVDQFHVILLDMATTFAFGVNRFSEEILLGPKGSGWLRCGLTPSKTRGRTRWTKRTRTFGPIWLSEICPNCLPKRV